MADRAQHRDLSALSPGAIHPHQSPARVMMNATITCTCSPPSTVGSICSRCGRSRARAGGAFSPIARCAAITNLATAADLLSYRATTSPRIRDTRRSACIGAKRQGPISVYPALAQDADLSLLPDISHGHKTIRPPPPRNLVPRPPAPRSLSRAHPEGAGPPASPHRRNRPPAPHDRHGPEA